MMILISLISKLSFTDATAMNAKETKPPMIATAEAIATFMGLLFINTPSA